MTTKTLKTPQTRVEQGDIIRDIELVEYITETDGIIEISKIVYPFCVILTQDCELQQDYTSRKRRSLIANDTKNLLSVLVAPMYNAELFFQGIHLEKLGGISGPTFSKTNTDGRMVIQNKNPRYHSLEFDDSVPIVNSIVDFKHYFSTNVELLRQKKGRAYVSRIAPLHRELLTQRFAAYLSRIGLP